MSTAGGMLFKCNSTLRSSDCQDLGILMTNVANKVMSARYGSNETLVSTSHSRKVPTQCKVAVSKAGNFIRY